VKYKGAAKERPGTLRRQHREQNSSLNAAVQQARERVEEDNPVMFTLPGSEVAAGKQVLVLEALQLAHARCAAGLARGWSDAHGAKGTERLWQNHFAENAAGAGAAVQAMSGCR
jgi:hypothetical protein